MVRAHVSLGVTYELNVTREVPKLHDGYFSDKRSWSQGIQVQQPRLSEFLLCEEGSNHYSENDRYLYQKR